MFTDVVFTSRYAAEQLSPNTNGCVISVTDPHRPPASINEGWRDILRLQFHDLVRVDDWPGDDLLPGPCIIFSDTHAEQVIAFLDHWHLLEDGPTRLIVHCEMGVSRSAAIARFAAQRFGLAFDWNYRFHNKHVVDCLWQYADAGAT